MTGTRRHGTNGKARRVAEIRRLLTRLADGAQIALDEEGGYRLTDRTPVARRIVEACLAGDWLERQGTHFGLSHVGRQRLRRLAADGADRFREQHQIRATAEHDVDGVRRRVTSNEGESPLGWLRSRKDRNGKPLIDEAQYEAGERLRADYWFAHMSPRVTANWSVLAPAERARRGAPTDPGCATKF